MTRCGFGTYPTTPADHVVLNGSCDNKINYNLGQHLACISVVSCALALAIYISGLE